MKEEYRQLPLPAARQAVPHFETPGDHEFTLLDEYRFECMNRNRLGLPKMTLDEFGQISEQPLRDLYDTDDASWSKPNPPRPLIHPYKAAHMPQEGLDVPEREKRVVDAYQRAAAGVEALRNGTTMKEVHDVSATIIGKIGGDAHE